MSVERGVHQSAVLCPFTWDESCSGDSSCRPGTSLLNRGNAYFLFPPKRPKELSAPERDSEAALIALNDASWCSQRSGLEGR